MPQSQKPKIKPTSAFVDISPTGELQFCYKGRKDGKKFVEKLTLKEIEDFLREYAKGLIPVRSFEESEKFLKVSAL